MRFSSRVLPFVLLALLGLALPASAQNSGAVIGKVIDQDGAPYGFVDVFLESIGGNYQGAELADDEGRFTFRPVPTGDYKLYAYAAGFSSTLFEDEGELYLAMEVDSDGEMVPRHRLASAPYALRADTARNADDVQGSDINPASITVDGVPVIDANGNWVGPTSGLQGPIGPTGAPARRRRVAS